VIHRDGILDKKGAKKGVSTPHKKCIELGDFVSLPFVDVEPKWFGLVVDGAGHLGADTRRAGDVAPQENGGGVPRRESRVQDGDARVHVPTPQPELRVVAPVFVDDLCPTAKKT